MTDPAALPHRCDVLASCWAWWAAILSPLVEGDMPLAEAVTIGVLESVVHGLDLARALAIEPDLPGEALRLTAMILTEMIEPVSFIEAATGRSPHAVLPVLR